MAQHIKQFLTNILPQEESWKRYLLEHWPTIMGRLHSKVTIENIYEDYLVLGVPDACWLQELYLLSPALIKQINEKLETPRIKQVRFKQVGRMQKKVVLTPQATVRTPKVVQLNEQENNALTRIADTDLQAALKSYLIRCYQEKE
jgi:hypothetical protein